MEKKTKEQKLLDRWERGEPDRLKIKEVEEEKNTLTNEKYFKIVENELDKEDVVLMLDVHRKFAKNCLFGDNYEPTVNNKHEKSGQKLIDFTTFSRLMTTDSIIYSYSDDVRVSDFSMNLSDNGKYYGQDLEWNISMIDIEILFNELRENQFIAHDTPRNIFFEIFNPNLFVFNKPIQWIDIKELAYFLDKCREYSLFENYKYQNIVEKYRMFKTNFSKGDYIKSNSLRTTLADVKDEFGNYSENQKFLKRVEFLEEIFSGMDCDCCTDKIFREEE